MVKQIFIALFLSSLTLACSKKQAIQESIPTSSEVQKSKSLAPGEKIPTDPAVKIGKLENGLTYYIQSNPKPTDKLELRLVINAGSILEDSTQQGLAHFMEHMNFNGTKNFEAGELIDYLQTKGVRFGAHLNAYTSFDETVYILPVPSDDKNLVDTAFLILQDWAQGALLSDEEIEKERGVVLEEYRTGLGAERRLLPEYLPKLLPDSKYPERLPIGKKEVLETFKPDDLRRFYRDWYRPDLMAVVAVGDFDPDLLEEKIKSNFSSLTNPSNAPERTEFFVGDTDKQDISILSDPEYTNSRIDISFRDENKVEPLSNIGQYRSNLERRLFARMLNLRLDELRNSTEPPFITAVSQYSSLWSRNKNAFQGFVLTEVGKELEGFRALITEYERLNQHGFTEAELENARKSVSSRMEKRYSNRSKQVSRSLASRYISHFLTDNALPSIEWQYEMHETLLPSITVEEVNALIPKFITYTNKSIVMKTPPLNTKANHALEMNQALSYLYQTNHDPYVFQDPGSELLKSIPKAGSIAKEEKDEQLDITTLTLSNGLKIIYKKTDFKDDEIIVWANSYGGTSLYSNEELTKTRLANNGLTEAGLNGFTKNDLTKLSAGKNAYIAPYISNISEGFRGSTTPSDLEFLFQYVHLYFTKVNKDQAAFDSYAERQKALLANQLKNPRSYFFNQMNKYFSGEDPRYQPFPTEEHWAQTDYSLAWDKYQERFENAGDFTFFFVGNIDEEKLKQLAATYLASLKATASNEKFVDHGFRPKSTGNLEVKRGQEQQAMVMVSFRGETEYTEQESYELSSLAEVLSIKLIEILREEKGGVYGAGANGGLSKLPYGSYGFSISFPCSPENVDELRAAALSELNKIIQNGPTDEDVAKVKKAQVESYEDALERNSYWMSHLSASNFNQRDIYSILNRKERIAGLTKEKLQEVARKYLSGEPFYATLFPEE